MDIVTGVLPKDKELLKLRAAVITQKQNATRYEHRRFFDRLGELIVKFVRDGDRNYQVFGPTPLDWEEFCTKLAYSPPRDNDFRNYLVEVGISAELGRSLVQLGVLDAEGDRAVLERLQPGGRQGMEAGREAANGRALATLLTRTGMTLTERVQAVVDGYIEPILRNDGGRIELLGVDESQGEVTVRFMGSCANCPYSMLSLESIVHPALLGIPGVEFVRHRGLVKRTEFERIAPGSCHKPAASLAGGSLPASSWAEPSLVV
jgi:Fe-S cluster biogenesis protein NfuA